MSIGKYIKVIGRGKDGAKSLTREQANDLFGQVLDGAVTDLETGAFCLAMRIKGETSEEMAGFLDATHARLHKIPTHDHVAVVLPSYNGARRLPVLTPLLALLLAREGVPVIVHGTNTEPTRVSAEHVFLALGLPPQAAIAAAVPGKVQYVSTGLLCPGLQRLLDVRRVVGLRNPGHSLVKLMNPCDGAAVVVSSYTHPEYAESMAATFKLLEANAMLLHGTEGEPVADARRTPAMDTFIFGQMSRVQDAQTGTLHEVPNLPAADAASTAAWIQSVMDGKEAIPTPIALQAENILRLTRKVTHSKIPVLV